MGFQSAKTTEEELIDKLIDGEGGAEEKRKRFKEGKERQMKKSSIELRDPGDRTSTV